MKKHTLENFIELANEKHNFYYDYSDFVYENNRTPGWIICPIHGKFKQKPINHLKGCGCPECGKTKNKRSMSTTEFIEKANEVHGGKYDYSMVDMENRDDKGRVCIICKTCGNIFWQTPANHLKGVNCRVCKYKMLSEKFASKTEIFVEKAREVHGDKYDYSETNYERKDKKIKIICHELDDEGNEHGVFYQTPNNHLTGYGCSKCAGIFKVSFDVFVKRSNKKHNFKYIYPQQEIKNIQTKVCIICPKHGEFYQTPDAHMQGQGCPKCNQSKLEKEISNFLIENNIQYIYQATHKNEGLKWLETLSLDFFLPEYNIAIECQGIEHFIPINFFGGEERFKYVQNCDKRKNILCKNNNTNLLYYTTINIIKSLPEKIGIENIITDKNKILEIIKNA